MRMPEVSSGGVHNNAVSKFGFYFGVKKIGPVRVELAPLISSGGVFRDKNETVMLINANKMDISDGRTSRGYATQVGLFIGGVSKYTPEYARSNLSEICEVFDMLC